MTTLYMSMSANEKDLEIEDDLAKGMAFVSGTMIKGGQLTFQQPRRFCETSSLKFLPNPKRTSF